VKRKQSQWPLRWVAIVKTSELSAARQKQFPKESVGCEMSDYWEDPTRGAYLFVPS
jgi:hypothetical protein